MNRCGSLPRSDCLEPGFGRSGLASTYAMLLITDCSSALASGYGRRPHGAGRLVSGRASWANTLAILCAIPVGSALGFLMGAFWPSVLIGGWHFMFRCRGNLLGLICLLMRDPREHGAAGHPKRPVANHSLKDYASWPGFLLTSSTRSAWRHDFRLGAVAFWMPNYIYRFRREDSAVGRRTEPGARQHDLWRHHGHRRNYRHTFGGWLGDKLRARWSVLISLCRASACSSARRFSCWCGDPVSTAWGLIFLTEFCLLLNTARRMRAGECDPAGDPRSAFAINIFLIHLLGDAVSPSLSAGSPTGRRQHEHRIHRVSVAIALSGVLWISGARFWPPTRLPLRDRRIGLRRLLFLRQQRPPNVGRSRPMQPASAE